MKNTLITRFALCATLLSAPVVCSYAAPIAWGVAQNISGDSDVSLAGDLVYAFNIGLPTGTNTTVNGVTFASARHEGVANQISFSGSPTSTATAYGSTSNPFASLSSNYKFILQSATYRTDANGGAFTIILHGLTVGTDYQIQVWTNDSRAITHAITGGTSFSSSGGNSVALEFNSADAAGGLGQYSIGSFIATAATQEITLNSITTSGGSAMINALQLREIPNIPESGSSALLLGACAVAGIFFLRRR